MVERAEREKGREGGVSDIRFRMSRRLVASGSSDSKRLLHGRRGWNPSEPPASLFFGQLCSCRMLRQVREETLGALSKGGNQVTDPDEYDVSTTTRFVLKKPSGVLAGPVPYLAGTAAGGFQRLGSVRV